MKLSLYFGKKKYFKTLKLPPKRYFFLFFHLLSVFQATAAKQIIEKYLNLNLHNVSLPEALNTIEVQSGVNINYNPAILDYRKKVSIKANHLSISSILQQLLKETGISFKRQHDDTILLYKAEVKNGKVAGKIRDEHGEPLPGATVQVEDAGLAVQTGIDGTYTIQLPQGNYTIKISYISYQSKRITNVEIHEAKVSLLDVSLQPTDNRLSEVTVTADFRKASIDGLLARQKNASEISNGISAEQILRTPDLHIGESLKRISGINTIENKFVVVRGIGERYNAAMLDGTILPSTEANSRQFSFDLIPSDLVDNITVSKTLTPDMNASFGGGLIKINTKDIPTENFTSLTIGSYYNDQSTGKDFLSHKRGKYDFWGFDDGRRSFPSDLQHTDKGTVPNDQLTEEEFIEKVVNQSKRFSNDNFSVYRYKAMPAQNYQFTIGRVYNLDGQSTKKIGFTGAVSYRNFQTIENVSNVNRGSWLWEPAAIDSLGIHNTATNYKFNTNWGSIFNAGLQLEKHRLSTKNTYTRTYNNALVRTSGYENNIDVGEVKERPPRIEEADRPVFTSLLQNKVLGEHLFGKIKMEWDVAYTKIKREEKDIITAQMEPKLVDGEFQYFYLPNTNPTEPRVKPMSRQYYANSEKHYTWGIAGTIPFDIQQSHHRLKLGYFGQRKRGDFSWIQASLYANVAANPGLQYMPIGEMVNPNNMASDGFQYRIGSMNYDAFEGKNRLEAFYAMLDNRIWDKLRLIWGLRSEYFKYTELKTPPRSSILPVRSDSIPDKKWSWLPSANVTYALSENMNIRAAWSNSVVRPELMDNNEFLIYSPYLGGELSNFDLKSSKVTSYDFKWEWYAGLGEIISVGGYYKYFKNPVELSKTTVGGAPLYLQKNSDYAKVYGLELELRKRLNFIFENDILNKFTLFGNLTLQNSTVQASFQTLENGGGETTTIVTKPVKNKRPMYGNAPYVLNTGLQYDSDRFNFNVVYNKTGYKTYIISDTPDQIEYEMPRSQLDAQVGYRFIKHRLLVKLNAANIFNRRSAFYRNTGSYTKALSGVNDEAVFKEGFSAHYDEGDLITYRLFSGRTYSILLTYTF
ncbi:TonB-dependent receptor [Olivibacter sp. CPCC 100613]|uniref:TonB-dependent receptor domain-containing protein n=1 Tax=Olivibacter sp. CPCC 100613 TaxID=3079931 RepID=UPI002FF84572